MQSTLKDAKPPVIRMAELASMLDMSDRAIRKQVAEGRIPAPAKFGSAHRWPRVMIEKWIADGMPAIEGGAA